MSAVPENVVINPPEKGPGGRPRLFPTVADLERKIEGYFKSLEKDRKTYINSKTGIPMTVAKPAIYTRLLLHIGFTFQTVAPYVNGEYDEGDEKYSDALTRARMRCQADLEEGAAEGIYEGRTTTQILGRHHEYSQKVELTGKDGGPVEFKGVLEEWSR
jgi:hypothetical protein